MFRLDVCVQISVDFCLSVGAMKRFRELYWVKEDIDKKETDSLIIFLQKADQMIRLIH